MGPRRRGPANQKASSALPPSRFVELYAHQQLGLCDIASMVGVSEYAVAELARDYAIPLRPAKAASKYTIDRDWLYTEHITYGRSPGELARERGVSGSTVTKCAKIHDIPVRRLSRYSPESVNANADIPAVLVPALIGQGVGSGYSASPG